MRPVWVEVDLDNIKHNIREIKNYIKKDVKLGGVVKANAYGHGAIEIAKVLEEENVDYICVAGLNEAMELRYSNINTKILVMGYTPSDCFNIAIENNISLTICSMKEAIFLSEVCEKVGKKAIIHIKVDTGFNRLGFDTSDNLKEIIEKIYNMENICVEGIFTHLGLKDESCDIKQFKKFQNLLSEITHLEIPIKHICDSIAMVAYKDFHMDMVRVGASIYGYNSRKSTMNLKPAITFKSKLSRIKYIKKGEGVSYDYTYVAENYMKIGTVTCGYSDGLSRLLSNTGYVFINGKKANIIGKMCMDQCMVDLSNVGEVNKDTEVIFYGENGPELLDVANLCQTNRNEIISMVSRRVVRVYIKNNKIYKILDYLKGDVMVPQEY